MTSTRARKARASCTVAALLLSAAGSAGAQIADLVDHDGFDACWSRAVTTDDYLVLVADAIESGTAGCIPAGQVNGEDYCNLTTCPGDVTGCPVKVHSGAFVLGSQQPPDGSYLQVQTSSGSIDPFAMPMTLPIVGDCIVSFVDTSTTTLAYPLYFPTRYDGTAGLYTTDFPNMGNLAINGLDASDVSVSGSLACAVTNFGLSYFIGALSDVVAQQLQEQIISQSSDIVGQSVCPARP